MKVESCYAQHVLLKNPQWKTFSSYQKGDASYYFMFQRKKLNLLDAYNQQDTKMFHYYSIIEEIPRKNSISCIFIVFIGEENSTCLGIKVYVKYSNIDTKIEKLASLLKANDHSNYIYLSGRSIYVNNKTILIWKSFCIVYEHYLKTLVNCVICKELYSFLACEALLINERNFARVTNIVCKESMPKKPDKELIKSTPQMMPLKERNSRENCCQGIKWKKISKICDNHSYISYTDLLLSKRNALKIKPLNTRSINSENKQNGCMNYSFLHNTYPQSECKENCTCDNLLSQFRNQCNDTNHKMTPQVDDYCENQKASMFFSKTVKKRATNDCKENGPKFSIVNVNKSGSGARINDNYLSSNTSSASSIKGGKREIDKCTSLQKQTSVFKSFGIPNHVGFQTASGKNLPISEGALSSAKSIFMGVCDNEEVHFDLNTDYESKKIQVKNMFDLSEMDSVGEMFDEKSYNETDEGCVMALKMYEEGYNKAVIPKANKLESPLMVSAHSCFIPQSSTPRCGVKNITKKRLGCTNYQKHHSSANVPASNFLNVRENKITLLNATSNRKTSLVSKGNCKMSRSCNVRSLFKKSNKSHKY